MERPTIAIKVDADTFVGTRDGIPRILDILGRFGVKATFYFSLGPDNTGKAVRRIITRRGFLRTSLRLNAPALLGPRTLLSGLLIPPPIIGNRLADTIRLTARLGHEVGIHGWDHVKWHDLLPWIPKKMIALELGRACALFEEVMGRRARTAAAPGWTVSADSLEIQDSMLLSFCSDCRGRTPFYPVMDGRRFGTLQVPTTLPTLDELLGGGIATEREAVDRLMGLVGPGLNVHTVQAEIEGKRYAPHLASLLDRLTGTGARFVTLGEAADEAKRATVPVCRLTMEEIPGRPGRVAVQGEEWSEPGPAAGEP